MKNKLLLKIFALLLATILLLTTFSMAAYSDVTMEVVNEPVGRVYFTDRSYFEKSLYHKDLANKEVTIQLKVVNDELPEIPTGEIVLLIDNSDSMTKSTEVNGKTRYELIQDSAKQLVTQLLGDNPELEIAIASFSSVPNSEAATKEGTLEDAKTVQELTSDLSTLTSAIDNIEANGPRTDLEAGLTVAEGLFSEDETKEKYMVVLTDGVPNVYLNYEKIYYTDTCFEATKNKLLSLESDGIHLITMLTELEEPDKVPGDQEGASQKTYSQIANAVFGTPESPTAGSYYYVADSDVEKTVTEDIYNDLKPRYQTLTNIKITDYFPQEIIENFDFAYVSEPTHGEISPSVNTENNSITWEIPELEAGDSAVVQYKLKLKEGFDTSILDKVLDTNDGVSIEYTDFNGKNQKTELTDTPQLKLTEPKPPILPAAGSQMFILAIAVAGGIVGFSALRYATLKNKLN